MMLSPLIPSNLLYYVLWRILESTFFLLIPFSPGDILCVDSPPSAQSEQPPPRP